MRTPINPATTRLVAEVKNLVVESRQQMAVAVNAEISLLYWHIGMRINIHLEGAENRPAYGQQVVALLAQELSTAFGTTFTEKYLRRMMQFAKVFADKAIVVSLIRQLSWTHLLALIPIKDSLQRAFYAELCRLERWSARLLRAKIDGMLYERTAISRQPEAVIFLPSQAALSGGH